MTLTSGVPVSVSPASQCLQHHQAPLHASPGRLQQPAQPLPNGSTAPMTPGLTSPREPLAVGQPRTYNSGGATGASRDMLPGAPTQHAVEQPGWLPYSPRPSPVPVEVIAPRVQQRASDAHQVVGSTSQEWDLVDGRNSSRGATNVGRESCGSPVLHAVPKVDFASRSRGWSPTPAASGVAWGQANVRQDRGRVEVIAPVVSPAPQPGVASPPPLAAQVCSPATSSPGASARSGSAGRSKTAVSWALSPRLPGTRRCAAGSGELPIISESNNHETKSMTSSTSAEFGIQAAASLAPRVVKEEFTIIRPRCSSPSPSAETNAKATTICSPRTVGRQAKANIDDVVSNLMAMCAEKEGRDKEREAAVQALQKDMEAVWWQLRKLQGREPSSLLATEEESKQDCEDAMAQLRSKLQESSTEVQSPDVRGAANATLTLQREVDILRATGGAQGDRLDAIARNVAAVAASVSAFAVEAKWGLGEEAEKRAAADEGMHSRMQVLISECAATARDHVEFREELQELRNSVDAVSQRTTDLQTSVERLSQGLASNASQTCLSEIREGLASEKKDRALAEQATSEMVRDAIEQERAERRVAMDTLRLDATAPLASVERELSALRARLQDVEESAVCRLGANSALSRLDVNEQLALNERLEKRCAELARSMEEECQARTNLADEVEQVVKSQRTKLRTLIAQMSDTMKTSYDELRASTHDLFEKERAVRNAQQETLEGRLSIHQGALDEIRRGISEMKIRQREQQVAHDMRSESKHHQDCLEDLVRQYEQMQLHLQEERRARIALQQQVCERFVCLDDFFGGMRQVMSQPARRPEALSKRSLDQGCVTTMHPVHLLSHKESWSGDHGSVGEADFCRRLEVDDHAPYSHMDRNSCAGSPSVVSSDWTTVATDMDRRS